MVNAKAFGSCGTSTFSGFLGDGAGAGISSTDFTGSGSVFGAGGGGSAFTNFSVVGVTSLLASCFTTSVCGSVTVGFTSGAWDTVSMTFGGAGGIFLRVTGVWDTGDFVIPTDCLSCLAAMLSAEGISIMRSHMKAAMPTIRMRVATLTEIIVVLFDMDSVLLKLNFPVFHLTI